MSAPRGPRRLARPEAVEAHLPPALREAVRAMMHGIGLPAAAWPVAVHDLPALLESVAVRRFQLANGCSLAAACEAIGCSRDAHVLRVSRWWRAWRRHQRHSDATAAGKNAQIRGVDHEHEAEAA